ncbi:MAG: hypothetical protein K0R47_486 [Brevibacillus sp.]|nr:hypothetical protein [Brevibacillus sp.]
MKAWKRKLFASLFVLSLAFPISAHADESSGSESGHGYEDAPFQEYLADLIDSLDDTDYEKELSGEELDDFLEEQRKVLEDDGDWEDYRERLYQWIITHVDGPNRN